MGRSTGCAVKFVSLSSDEFVFKIKPIRRHSKVNVRRYDMTQWQINIARINTEVKLRLLMTALLIYD